MSNENRDDFAIVPNRVVASLAVYGVPGYPDGARLAPTGRIVDGKVEFGLPGSMSPDQEARFVAKVRADGLLGVAGFDSTASSEPLAEFTAHFGTASPENTVTVVEPGYPAPWRWEEDLGGDRLVDAEGGVIVAVDPGVIDTTSPLARELIRLAPEMAGLLRDYTEIDGCPHGTARPNCLSCRGAAILAALDAAKNTAR